MKWRLLLGAIVLGSSPAFAWDIPADNGTMTQATVREILQSNDYPETSTYRQAVEFIDFSANGQNFTQVVVTLTPDKPLLRNGKKIVVAGGEPGSEYGMDFVTTIEGKDGPAVWLAKRGVTFVALTRVGRWNFLAPTRDGSWETVPIGKRMPIFNRAQKAHWTDTDYEAKQSGLTAGASASTSLVYRYPRKGTLLEKQMLAATPRVFIEGYRLALEKAVPDRARSLVLFWGMSTGGASLYPLAKYYTPDGYLGWGTSSTGLAYVSGKARRRTISATSTRRWRCACASADWTTSSSTPSTSTRRRARNGGRRRCKIPRFKSTEDCVHAVRRGRPRPSTALRLWNSDFLPAQDRERGLGGVHAGDVRDRAIRPPS